MIKLVLTDIDNTLIPLGAGKATDRALAGIHALLDAGVAFGPATGRDLDGMTRFFRGDEDCWRTGLISNGKLIYLNGELVKATYFDHGQVEAMCGVVRANDDALAVLRVDEVDYAFGATDEQLAAAADVLGENLPGTDVVPDGDILTVTLMCEGGPDRCEEVADRARAAAPGLEFLSPVAHVYDVVPRGWNKATALEELMRAMGVSPEEVVVFGDSQNDVPILRMVPNSVVVANAMPEAAEVARFRIGACADDAVADALLSIAEASARGEMPDFLT